MSEQYMPVLGKLADAESKRDAIHIAIAPVTASCFLKPGEHVGFHKTDYGEVGLCDPKDRIGIVDPFLTEDVQPGQRFYLCLYQNTVTSLRHVWTHPAFKAKVPGMEGKE